MNPIRSRPDNHFAPVRNWINDPNGLIFHGGYYHLFFQHNPYANNWGHMSWGHARSTDLVTWEELPVAITEQPDHAIFSGSAVWDEENDRLVAIYSGHKPRNQSQYISYSTDGGTNWSGNTKVLDMDMASFRDPKVFRHNGQWLMAVAKSNEHKVSFFESPDLVNWTFLSDYTAPDIDDLYECPDLFYLDGVWVLIISTNPGGPQGGSGTRYVIGEFDGHTFREKSEARYFDYGPDNYAAVTFNNTADRIAIGWMNNWLYAHDLDRQVWNGSMTAARRLSVENNLLCQQLVGETQVFRIERDSFAFVYGSGILRFRYDDGQLTIDRSELWDGGIAEFSIPVQMPLTLEVLFDAGSIEMLVNGLSVTCQLQIDHEIPKLGY